MKTRYKPDTLRLEKLILKKTSLFLKAIDHGLRQDILYLLHEQKGITVTQIYRQLALDQPVASMHLAILRKAGFVTTVRNGRFIYY